MPNLLPSLQFYDSVDHYTLLSDCALKWNRIAGVLIVNGRNGKGLDLQSTGFIGKTISHSHTNTVGFAFRLSAVPNNDIYQIFHDGTKIATVSLHPGGIVKYNTTTGFLGGGTFHTSASGQFEINKWHYIEIKTFTSGGHDTAVFATMEVRIDEQTLGEFSGTSGIPGSVLELFDLFGATCNYHQLASPGVSGSCVVDDIYIRNDGTFMGDTRIFTIYPNGDLIRDFLPLENPPTHFSLVNQHTPDGDTTYVESQFVGESELYDWENVPSNSTIKGIHYNIYHRKTGEFTRAWQYILALPLDNQPKIYSSDSYRYDSIAIEGPVDPTVFNDSLWGQAIASNT